MLDFFTKLATIDRIFVASAILGGGLVAIRVVMMAMGGDGDADVDVGGVDVGDVDGDVGMAGVEGHAGASDAAFRVLSLQGVSGFLLMFGLVGLALSRESNAGPFWSAAGGAVAGLFTMWLMAKLMFSLKKLQSSGTLNLENAVGAEGQVYLTVPGDGIGKVQVVIQERLKVFDARSRDGGELKTGERVRVTEVVSGRVLVVQRT